MSYAFPPDLAALVDRQMKVGGYQSQDEVLRAALAALEDSHKDSAVGDPAVVAAVRRSIAEFKAGLGVPFEEFDAQFRAQHGYTEDE